MTDITAWLDAAEARCKIPHQPEEDLARWIEAITKSHADLPRALAALRVAEKALLHAKTCSDRGALFDADCWLADVAAILEGRDD